MIVIVNAHSFLYSFHAMHKSTRVIIRTGRETCRPCTSSCVGSVSTLFHAPCCNHYVTRDVETRADHPGSQTINMAQVRVSNKVRVRAKNLDKLQQNLQLFT